MFLGRERCPSCRPEHAICAELEMCSRLRCVCSPPFRVWMPVRKCLLRGTPLLRCTQLLLQLQSRRCWENPKRKPGGGRRKDPEDLSSCWNTKSFDHLQTKHWLEVFFLVSGRVEQCPLHRPLNHACHQKNRFLFLFWKWLSNIYFHCSFCGWGDLSNYTLRVLSF